MDIPSTTACPAAVPLEPPQRRYPTPCGGTCQGIRLVHGTPRTGRVQEIPGRVHLLVAGQFTRETEAPLGIGDATGTLVDLGGREKIDRTCGRGWEILRLPVHHSVSYQKSKHGRMEAVGHLPRLGHCG